MQIIIEIDDNLYSQIKYLEPKANTMLDKLMRSIQNGTPLPKGHGDLIDISKLPVTTTYFGISDKPTKVVNYNYILNAKKIIKADKAESEG